MRQSMRKTLLWQGVGLLFYLGGLVLFLLVAVNVYLSPPANSIENLSSAHLPYLGLSVVLIVLGQVISWKWGGGGAAVTGLWGADQNQERDQSTLEQLGYHTPSDAADDADSGVVYEEGEVYVVCSECGAKNDQRFDYCRNCSAELPE